MKNLVLPALLGVLCGVAGCHNRSNVMKIDVDPITPLCPVEISPAETRIVPQSDYQIEEQHDESRWGDLVLSNLRIQSSQWPDCYSNETAVRDIFRIEGVQDKSDPEKAMALWKWWRIQVSSKCGGYFFEETGKGEENTHDGHAIFTVHGRHQCDGLSWSLVPLWRAAGYIAFDECTFGHTVASLRYRDQDGNERFHDFDPVARFFHWNEKSEWLSVWGGAPMMRGRVHRHLTAPQIVHTLRTALRAEEDLLLKWDNEGLVLPSGKYGNSFKIRDKEYAAFHEYKPGRKDAVYSVLGEAVQCLNAIPSSITEPLPAIRAKNIALQITPSTPTLSPNTKKEPAVYVVRMASPYIALEGTVSATLFKTNADDICRLSLSRDNGKTWYPIFVKKKTGEETVEIPIGLSARKEEMPNITTCYNFLVMVEMQSDTDPMGVGAKKFEITARRQFNKRTLPNLRPGDNVFKIDGEWVAKLHNPLYFSLRYRIDGEEKTVAATIHEFPFYFNINTGNQPEVAQKSYDEKFNTGPLQIISTTFSLQKKEIPENAAPTVLSRAAAAPFFAKASPHPANFQTKDEKKLATRLETDPMQTSGFFPQSTARLSDDEALNKLIATLKKEVEQKELGLKEEVGIEGWNAAADLGSYPGALDTLLEILPKADDDLLLFLCKALAQIGDKRAVAPLLERWKEVPKGAPGARYIPDVFAACGDQSVVPELIKPIKKVRFDFRLHIIRALGILGGTEAKAALEELAKNDPVQANRELAAEFLEKGIPGDRK